MPWPLPSDFQTILQNPKIAFRDPYLRSCQIERDLRGQPRAWAGSFAVVYKGIDATGKPLAIRVFSTESPKRRGRYEQIGEHLTARKLDCLVSFEYREDEIRSLSDGKRYPIVLMDWVEGETLFQWAQNQCQRGNLAAFAQAARQWPAVAAELSQEQIAHGDLQHANVMVTSQGELKLVDYDGMCVPALIGAECLEVGTPPYQHPQRSASSRLSLRLDDFSTLLIYDVLHALAAEPSLWAKYVEQTNNDKLLFREDDFRFPERSALRRDLLLSADPRVREITECVFAAATGRIDSVPRLHEVIKPREVPDRSTSQPISNQHNLPVPQSGKLHAGNLGKKPPRPPGQVALPKLRGYQLIAEIGKGALGAVFLAKSETSGRQVAVKFMPIPTTAKPTLRRRFLAETDRVSQVRHPNMAGTIEKGAVGQAFYFVTEYCDLGNLRSGWNPAAASCACGSAARDAALPRRPKTRAFAPPAAWPH